MRADVHSQDCITVGHLPDHVKVEGYICKERDYQPKLAARAGEDHRAWCLHGIRLYITWPPASADAASQLLTSLKAFADNGMGALDGYFRKWLHLENSGVLGMAEAPPASAGPRNRESKQ